MPSIADSFGLGAVTAWLSGSSKSENDVGRNSARPKKPKTPGRKQTLTISSDLNSEETDGLADELAATSLSENALTDADTVGHSHSQHEHGEEAPAMKAAFETSSDVQPGCQCCDWAFQTELTFRKVMQASQALGPGSTEYYDAVAHVYHRSPSQVARGKFLKQLINSLQEQNWIGLDSKKEGGVKVMDYAAGTGFLSQALAPHVTEILAIDKSRKMVDEYNGFVAKDNETKCEMKAVQGDMTTHFLSGEKSSIEHPDGAFEGFDMVAMCLGVDFFAHESAPKEIKHKEFMNCLGVMVDLLDENGTLLIIDIEKCDQDCSNDASLHSPGFRHDGLKFTGHGSKDIVEALEELGIEDIAVTKDQPFLFEAKHGSGPDAPTIRRKETYFVLKAKRGALFEERLFQRFEGFYRVHGFTEAGGEGWA